MTQSLESIFRELGLAQYLDAFVDQGFDTWDTILDIQESDLDALGVKLGHRRKLQRRIANARGIAPSVSLGTSANTGSDDGKQDTSRRESGRAEAGKEVNGVTKRKYRRHPKPDENAPERPPSAYVLFSNKMREDVKDQNLTFTEIAKLVGENWQSLASDEREAYESQANTAKERYHRDLAEYKKTPEYHRYAQYLHDFKERQAKHGQAHDSAKRAKFEPARLRHGSTSSSSAARSGTDSTRSGSSSDLLPGSEPSPTQQYRMSSTTSLVASPASSGGPTPSGPMPPLDITATPGSLSGQISASIDPNHRHRRRHSSWRETKKANPPAPPHLPSLSDILVDGQGRRPLPNGAANSPPLSGGFATTNPRRIVPDSSPVFPTGQSRSPLHESTTNSTTSSNSGSGANRALWDGPLPIHALLSHTPIGQTPVVNQGSPLATQKLEATNGSFNQPMQGARGYGFQSPSSAFQNMKMEQSGDGDVVMTPVEVAPAIRADNAKPSLDGMSALLKAGEIVDSGIPR